MVGGAGDFNCAVDDPEHDKQRAEKQSTSDESLNSATAFGQPVSPRHDLTSDDLFSNAIGKSLFNIEQASNWWFQESASTSYAILVGPNDSVEPWKDV